MTRSPAALLLLVVAACGSVAGPAGAPLPVNGFRPEDRVVIGSFAEVVAMAATSDRVYIVYPGTVAIWQPNLHRWDTPRSPPRANALGNVTAALADPLDHSLWLVAGDRWIHLNPDVNRWEEGRLPGRADAVATDESAPGSGVYFRIGAAAWARVPSLGGIATSSAPPRRPRFSSTIDDAMRDLPMLQAQTPQLVRGPRMIAGRLTAAARDPGGRGWYIGTSTRGAVFIDRVGAAVEQLALGIGGDAVGALLAAPGGVWVATDDDTRTPSSLTWLSDDLDSARSVTGTAAFGLPFGIARRLLAIHDTLWIATDKGVALVPPTGLPQRLDLSADVATNRALSLAEYQGNIVVGTANGITAWHNGVGFRRIAQSTFDPVRALAVAGDTLWAGTTRGLFAVTSYVDTLRMPNGFREAIGADVAVAGVGYVADTLLAMTRSTIYWRNPVTGAWTPGPLLDGQLGPLTQFVATLHGAWIAGARGVAFVQAHGAPLVVLAGPQELPGEVTALAVSPHLLWIGTRAGLVRYTLAP